ncbi:MAG: hypothetical protein V4684_19615 [Pseudomonadota bacterium]
MTLREIFENERKRYVELLLATKAELLQQSPATSSEVLISINNEAIPYPYRYLRIDILSKAADGAVRPYYVTPAPDGSAEPRGYNMGSFEMQVYPFTWNAVNIKFDQPLKSPELLEAWATRWLDIKDTHASAALAQAIHSLGRIEPQDDWRLFTVDFGSAPVIALTELIDLLATEGARRIILQSADVVA